MILRLIAEGKFVFFESFIDLPELMIVRTNIVMDYGTICLLFIVFVAICNVFVVFDSLLVLFLLCKHLCNCFMRIQADNIEWDGLIVDKKPRLVLISSEENIFAVLITELIIHYDQQ